MDFPGSSGDSVVKNQTAMQQTQVRYLGQKDPLEEGTAPTPLCLQGKSHGQRSREGCVYGAARSWTWVKWLGSSRALPGGAGRSQPANPGDAGLSPGPGGLPRCGATQPGRHNYWPSAPALRPSRVGTVLCNERSHCNEKPARRKEG